AKEKEGGKARETAVAQRGAASCESGPAFSPRAPQHRPLMPPALDGPATFRGRLAMSDCQEPKGPSKKRILDPDRRCKTKNPRKEANPQNTCSRSFNGCGKSSRSARKRTTSGRRAAERRRRRRGGGAHAFVDSSSSSSSS
ncbi:unnamed protein product, partial [Prorocentrum cordatum]